MKNLTAIFKLLILPLLFISFNTSLYAVELDRDTFDSSTDGWSNATQESGQLRIERDETAEKTYTFPTYANQQVTFTLEATDIDSWGNGDKLEIGVDGTIIIDQTIQGTAVQKTFNVTLDNSGEVSITLKPDTNNDAEDIYIDNIIITYTVPPVADAGDDRSIVEGNSITLYGSDSTGDNITYSWDLDGSTFIGETPTIYGLTVGTYTATLTVTDSINNTDTDTMQITVANNQAPVANAGVDQSIVVGNNVALDGTGSTDSDGTIVNYSWSLDGSTYTGALPTISGLAVGTYTATLTVTDDHGLTDTDSMQITVSAVPTSFTCANPRSYTQAFYANMTAEIDIIGNSVVCQDNNDDGVCEDPGDTRNNNIDMIHINIDGDSNTFNHSSAELNLPADSTIKWAGLYWQGMFTGPTTTQQNDSRTIKLKVPGGSYVDLTSDSSKFNWVYLKETNDRWMYQGVVEITDLMDPDNLNGYYGVANLHTREGKPAGGSFGAWSIIIVYENSDLPVQNVTVYDGYQGVMPGGNGDTCDDRDGDPKKACEYAEDNGCSIDLAATGVANPISVTLSGFLTPSSGTVNSTFALFSGEGDRGVTGDELSITNKSGVASFISDGQNPESDVQNATISKKGVQVTTLEPQATLAGGGTPWLNTLGADIDLFDATDILDNEQSSTVITMNTNGDGYFPGVFAFSTELFSPSLCYDYSYKQNEQFFTEDNNGSFEPMIIGDGLSVSDDVTVEFFIQNTELSDVVIDDMMVSIVDINTTQAEYAPSSTYVVRPDEVFPVLNTDTNFGASYNRDIPIGIVDSLDFFYIDYDLDIKSSTLNMPLTVKLNYNLSLPGLTIPLETYLGNDMPLCSSDNFSYNPIYGNFNVENSILSQTQKYNLPTQTANRAGDFVVTSYDVTNIHNRLGIFTPVAIELIDAGKYHSVEASCYEPDSALTPRVWVIFDNNVSVIPFDYDTITTAITNGTISDQISGGTTPIATAGEFYGRATENAAFRIGFNRAGDGNDIIQLAQGTCQGQDIPPCVEVRNFPDLSQVDLGNGMGRCIQDIDGNPDNADTIPQNCGNAGNAGMDSVQLAICMECIYGYNIDYLCSRDNFSIRPESFRMNLKDQDQSDKTLQSDLSSNNDTTIVHDATNASASAIQIVAGYDYDLEINATNHQNDNNTPGYYASFLQDGDGGDRSIRLNWETSTDDTKCNDTEDHNKTTTFFNGTTALDLNSTQIGKYTLTLLDRLWTRVDHVPAEMTHHTTGNGVGYFITTANSDCIDSSSAVPVENAATASYSEDVSGCDITTAYNDPTDSLEYHDNVNTDTVYTDIALRIHPYTFDHVGVIPAAGPSGKNFVYINTPDVDDKNMSYNMNGTFFATGHPDVYTGNFSNFVTGCYADDVNMTLYLQYQHAQPTDSEPFLSYDLIDINSIDSSIIRARPTAVPGEPTYRFSTMGPLSITQDEQYFVKDMNGSITMDLGYNFKRNYNEPMNPRFIQMNDFNITYLSNPADVKADLESDFQIFGNKDLNDNNISFIYGRAKPGKFFYEDIVDPSVFTPVSAIAYCDLGFTVCQNRGIMAAFAKTNEADWWLSIDHRTADNDGDIILVTGTPTEGSGSPTVTPTVTITNSDATDTTVQVVSNATELPMTVPINFVTDTTLASFTDDWLIYNEYDNNVTNPFYKVRFIGDSNWTGIGDEGMVVGTEASKRKTKRLDW